VALIEALLQNKIKIHALLPGTGDGVGKIAFDKRPFTYRIKSWMKIPPLMEYFNKVIGVALLDCLKTFNWGVGYYIFAPEEEVAKIIKIGKNIGYVLADVGIVEKSREGKRQVIFEPGNIILTPPGK